MYDMTHAYVWHDSFIYNQLPKILSEVRTPNIIYMCAMTHSYVCHDSFICEPWLLHTYEMSRSYVRHDTIRYHQLHTIWSEMRVIMYVISLFLSLIVTYDPFSLSHCHIWLFLLLSLLHMTPFHIHHRSRCGDHANSMGFDGTYWHVSHDSYHMTHITWHVIYSCNMTCSLSLSAISLSLSYTASRSVRGVFDGVLPSSCGARVWNAVDRRLDRPQLGWSSS